MFCPECRAEYRPESTRCSDCNVALVEHLSVAPIDADRHNVSEAAVLKELGPIIAIPIVFLALMILFVALGKNSFGIQIVSLVAYTGFVFLFIFCDTRGWKGYSLSEKVVRQKLPLILFIHAGFLAIMFVGVTGAVLLRPHLSDFWTVERGTRRPLSYFDLILLLTGVIILYSRVFLSRGILRRALKDGGPSA